MLGGPMKSYIWNTSSNGYNSNNRYPTDLQRLLTALTDFYNILTKRHRVRCCLISTPLFHLIKDLMERRRSTTLKVFLYLDETAPYVKCCPLCNFETVSSLASSLAGVYLLSQHNLRALFLLVKSGFSKFFLEIKFLKTYI